MVIHNGIYQVSCYYLQFLRAFVSGMVIKWSEYQGIRHVGVKSTLSLVIVRLLDM